MGRPGNHSERWLHALALPAHVLWRDEKRKEQAAAGFDNARVGLHAAAGSNVPGNWNLSRTVSSLHRETGECGGETSETELPDSGPDDNDPAGPDSGAESLSH